MIAAILRAQLLSMRMVDRGRVFGAITGLIYYGVWVVAACAVFLAVSGATVEKLRVFLPLGALVVWLYWQAMPILSASVGSALDMRKLMLYPVPHGKLFQVEVLLRLTTGGEMLFVLTGCVAGLFRNKATSGWAAVPAVALYVVFNLLVASGTRSLLERLLSQRRVREVLLFVIFMVWMVPRFLFITGHRPQWVGSWTHWLDTAVWPWTAVAWAALGRSEFYALLSLAVWTLLAGWFGRTQFERNLRFDSVAAQATQQTAGISRWQRVAEGFYGLPARWLRDPLAAMMEKELRSLSRTPRYRMVFIMGFSFGLMIWLPMILGNPAERNRKLSHHFLTVICVYSMTLLGQVSYWNCFGFDRSATLFYFAAPQPLGKVFAAKNLAALVFIYLEVLILATIITIFGVRLGGAQLLETLLVVGVCSLYMLALGNISSVQYPRGLNPERVSQGGATGRFQALITMLYPLSLLPVLLAYVARWALDSELVFWLVLGFAAMVGGALYWIAMESAVGTAWKQRERIIRELSNAEGPIASG